MIATVLLAAVAGAPLGLWPADVGQPFAVRSGVEFYVVEPEDATLVLAFQPLSPAVAESDTAALDAIAAVADRLGADAVLLLEELPVRSVPADPEAPLVGTGRFGAAAYLVFDCDCPAPEQNEPRKARLMLPAPHVTPPRAAPCQSWPTGSSATSSGLIGPGSESAARRSRSRRWWSTSWPARSSSRAVTSDSSVRPDAAR